MFGPCGSTAGSFLFLPAGCVEDRSPAYAAAPVLVLSFASVLSCPGAPSPAAFPHFQTILPGFCPVLGMRVGTGGAGREWDGGKNGVDSAAIHPHFQTILPGFRPILGMEAEGGVGVCCCTSPFSDIFAPLLSDFEDGDGDGAGWNWRESVVVSSPFSDGFAWILSLKFSFQVQRPEMARAHGSPTRWCLRQTTMMRYAGCRILWDAGRRAGGDRSGIGLQGATGRLLEQCRE